MHLKKRFERLLRHSDKDAVPHRDLSAPTAYQLTQMDTIDANDKFGSIKLLLQQIRSDYLVHKARLRLLAGARF